MLPLQPSLPLTLGAERPVLPDTLSMQPSVLVGLGEAKRTTGPLAAGGRTADRQTDRQPRTSLQPETFGLATGTSCTPGPSGSPTRAATTLS